MDVNQPNIFLHLLQNAAQPQIGELKFAKPLLKVA